MYSEKEENSKQKQEQSARRKKDMVQKNGRQMKMWHPLRSKGAKGRGERDARNPLRHKPKPEKPIQFFFYMAWLSMLKTTAASSTLRRRRNLRAQSRLLFRVRSFRSLSSLTRPSGKESHLHLRG